jgi:hypothetical protein
MRTTAIALTCILFSLSTSTFAAGGKNQTNNPIFGENCVETIPPGLDAYACEESPAPGQSGITVFFCDTTVVIVCADEDDGE